MPQQPELFETSKQRAATATDMVCSLQTSGLYSNIGLPQALRYTRDHQTHTAGHQTKLL